MMSLANPARIAIVGRPGAGKTTLARRIASQLNTVYIELDALYWQGTPVAAFQHKVSQALRQTS